MKEENVRADGSRQTWAKTIVASDKFQVMSVVLALIALGGFFMALGKVASERFKNPKVDQLILNKRFEERISQLERSNRPPVFVMPTSVSIDSMAIRDLTGRMKALEDAIAASPEKALSLPLVRKDLELLQRMQTEDRLSVRAELERFYDLSKWFMGLIGTLVLSTLGMAITTLRKSKPPRDDVGL